MIHFQAQLYDCVMYNQLLRETTDRDVSIEQLSEKCRF